MARASWKYYSFKQQEVLYYTKYLLDLPQDDFIIKRFTTITKLNYFVNPKLSTGKYLIKKSFSKYHIGLKFGSFTKNRKPFYFRSKKKKNVTKKYNI